MGRVNPKLEGEVENLSTAVLFLQKRAATIDTKTRTTTTIQTITVQFFVVRRGIVFYF
jgi:hypothetical protein